MLHAAMRRRELLSKILLTKQLQRVRLRQRGHDDALAVALGLRLGPHVNLSVHRHRGGRQVGRVDPLLRIVLRLKDWDEFLLISP